MRKLFRIFSLFLLSVGMGACETETTGGPVVKETIVDGNLDQGDLFPHVVLVDGGCTGTVIGPRQVLSAAHCFCQAQDQEDGGWTKNASYCNGEATITLTAEGENPALEVSATVRVHPGYIMTADGRGNLLRSEADLAVLELDACVPDTTSPIDMVAEPPAVAPGGVTLGRIVGFGNNTCDAKLYLVQRWWGDAFVTGVDAEFLEVSSMAEIAGEERTGAISWQGDSGGPLLLDPAGQGWQLAGVLSKGTCGVDEGDIAWYTNIERYREWILEESGSVDISGCTDDIPPKIQDLTLSYHNTSGSLLPNPADVGFSLKVDDPNGTGVEKVWVIGALEEAVGCTLPYDKPELWSEMGWKEFGPEPEAGRDTPFEVEGMLSLNLGPGQRGCVGAVAWDVAGNHSEMRTVTIYRCIGDCSGNGTCDHDTGICQCDSPYSGDGCEVCTTNCTGRFCGNDECGGSCGRVDSPECSGQGVCDESKGSCICDDPYSGDHCELCIPDCTGHFCGDDGCGGSCGLDGAPDCNDQGICSVDTGTCLCSNPYSGDRCEICTADCTGKICGDDGCGGSCGQCDSPPVLVCSNTTEEPSAEDMLLSYAAEGSCASGLCIYPEEKTACAPYGCFEAQCLPKCFLAEHKFQDFALSPEPEPSSSDMAYVEGTLKEVALLCDSNSCEGEVGSWGSNMGSGASYYSGSCDDNTNSVSYSFDGSVVIQCGDGPEMVLSFPEDVAVMLQCEENRYECPADTVDYSEFNGALIVSECSTTMGVLKKCDSALRVFFKVKNPETGHWYIYEPHEDIGGFPCSL